MKLTYSVTWVHINCLDLIKQLDIDMDVITFQVHASIGCVVPADLDTLVSERGHGSVWGLTFYASWDEVKGAILATNILAGTIDPDVGGLTQVAWQVQVQVAVQDFFVNASIGGSFKGSGHLQNQRINGIRLNIKYGTRFFTLFTQCEYFYHVIVSWFSKF